MLHTSLVNVVAWVLTVAGGVAFAAATVGVLYCLITLGHRSGAELAAVDLRLHDTYYVIRHSRFVVWPLLLCMCLSAAVMILGYMYTNLHMSRLMRSSMSGSGQD